MNDMFMRKELVKELQVLGMFDDDMLEKVKTIFFKTPNNAGILREAYYQYWFMEERNTFQGMKVFQCIIVLMHLLGAFCTNGLELLVEDNKKLGAKLVYARFLESAFQYFTRTGDEYEIALKLGRLNWLAIYVLLGTRGWHPFEEETE